MRSCLKGIVLFALALQTIYLFAQANQNDSKSSLAGAAQKTESIDREGIINAYLDLSSSLKQARAALLEQRAKPGINNTGVQTALDAQIKAIDAELKSIVQDLENVGSWNNGNPGTAVAQSSAPPSAPDSPEPGKAATLTAAPQHKSTMTNVSLSTAGAGQTSPTAADNSAATPQGADPSKVSTGNGGGATVVDQAHLNTAAKDANQAGERVSLVLGLGSLVTQGESDYQVQSNILSAKSLGHATPQLLTGIAFRTWVPNFHRFSKGCTDTQPCDTWRLNPWNAFVSLKFAPGTSEPINGYVIGGSYSIHSHFDILMGYALTPINEPSPGFVKVSAQAVTNGQPNYYKTFDPAAMLSNQKNAFDGFPIASPATGALIYQGNPLTTHYRGGAVFGVSFPFSFGSFLKPSGSTTPPNPSGNDNPTPPNNQTHSGSGAANRAPGN